MDCLVVPTHLEAYSLSWFVTFSLTPQDCRPPSGELLKAIEGRWGSLDKFVAEFNAKTAAVQVRRITLAVCWSFCTECRSKR